MFDNKGTFSDVHTQWTLNARSLGGEYPSDFNNNQHVRILVKKKIYIYIYPRWERMIEIESCTFP